MRDEQSFDDEAAGYEPSGPGISVSAIGTGLLSRLRRYFPLLFLLLAIGCVAALGMLVATPPQYTAEATVGPAASTLDKSTSGGGTGGGLLSGASSMLSAVSGGGLSGLMGKSTFDQYTNLLTSNRVAADLSRDPNIMHSVFYKRYDWNNNCWKVGDGAVSATVKFFKRLIHFPIKDVPDQDDLAKRLDQNVNVDAPMTSSFVTVSMQAKDPKEAEWLLGALLLDADKIIRQDRRIDVQARIAYLNAILPSIEQSDQKESLIQILNSQLQQMMTLSADNRYASALIDPPHANLTPTSPVPKSIFSAMILAASMLWVFCVYRLREDQWILRRFSSNWFQSSRGPTTATGSENFSKTSQAAIRRGSPGEVFPGS